MIIYIFRGGHKGKREELLKKAFEMYEKEKSLPDRSELKFSISHTGDIWGCLVSTGDVGFDIQNKKNTDYIKLSKRFFLDSEVEYVKKNGATGFFDIWTRKEACVKYFKTGLLRDIKSFSLTDGNTLTEKVFFRGRVCYVNSFDLSEDVKCAYCSSMRGEDIWLRELK